MHNTVEGATINSTRDQTNCYENMTLQGKRMIKIADLNKKFLLIGFAVFSFVYFTLDRLNLSYSKMAKQFGIWLVC